MAETMVEPMVVPAIAAVDDTAGIMPSVWTVVAYVEPKSGAVIMAVSAKTAVEAATAAFLEYCELQEIELKKDDWRIICVLGGIHEDHTEEVGDAFPRCTAV